MAKNFYIVFAAGGTGGHLFPAIAVAGELRRRHPEAAIDFVGGKRGLETRLVPQAGFPLRTLPVAGLKGTKSFARIVASAAAALAVFRCVWWFLVRRPGLVVGAGGYASGPAVLAAWLLRVPTMLMEQNHFPGATNRWLAPRANAVCVPSQAARARLGGTGLITGNPVRPEFATIGPSPNGRHLGLLVFGGSRGARSINRAVVAALPQLAAMTPTPLIVHQTGPEEHEAVVRAYASHPALTADVRPFLDDMSQRLAAADLVICRAGASTVTEIAAAGVASVMVPYPHAVDDHQTHNARYLAERGAAVLIPQREFTPENLARLLSEFTRERLLAMAQAARAAGKPDATRAVADVCVELAA